MERLGLGKGFRPDTTHDGYRPTHAGRSGGCLRYRQARLAGTDLRLERCEAVRTVIVRTAHPVFMDMKTHASF